ncbi:DUF547 domain-containing protein [Halobacterium jilantaiense]|uniref:DUF547 domain-containing protein n=1 Tax=Halobacterium jilantaiense TaxID=355548 RepID=A0A1I0QNQ2_9EURY|nr:DUF547 domain-containing protein [Halobacterium jilantaiense]SEW28707.1 Protein of unknown function, DUF547 [Halobacterium jilantaiense]
MFAPNARTTSPYDLVAAAQRLRHAAHHEREADALFDSLADVTDGVLGVLRDDQDAALAFWLNVHGALVDRGRSGDRARCEVAGETLTADDVKHGVLRANRWKYGFGYLPDPLPGDFLRRHRLRELDERVHFATLTARHVPGMAVTFTAANVDDELYSLTRRYLQEAAEYDPERGVVAVPRVCFWYRGDFGGASGVLSLLATHGVVPVDATPRLTYVAPAGSGDSVVPTERARGDAQ